MDGCLMMGGGNDDGELSKGDLRKGDGDWWKQQT